LNLAKHKKTRPEMHWTKARARVFSILCVSMCSRSLNSSPKGPDPPTTRPPCVKLIISFWPKCTRPKPNQPHASKESCLVYKRLKSNHPIHVSKKMEPSPSLCLRNPHSSPRGIVNPYVSNAQAKVQKPNPKTRVLKKTLNKDEQ